MNRKPMHGLAALLLIAFCLPLASCALASPSVTTPGGTTTATATTPEPTTPERTTVPAPIGYANILSVSADPALGSVNRSREDDAVPVGDTLTLTAVPEEGCFFVCWTVGQSLLSGGTRTDGGETMTLTAGTDSITYCANFLPDGGTFLIYHPGNGEEDTVTSFSHDFFLCPNTIPDTGVFRRDGYTLLEYNTKKDFSGVAVNPGGKVAPSETGITELWARWAKWSDASLFTVADGVLTRYSGNENPLVIPAEIGGKPVTGIAAGAVSEKSFSTLVIPKTVTEIADGAFVGCDSFDRLYLCDTVLSVSDAAFTDCRAYRTLCLNAATPPVSGNNFFGGCSIKYERLLTLPDDGIRTIVTLGGSSMVYGLDSPHMEELLGDGFRVINYGTNQGTCGLFYAEVCSKYLSEGDIFICAPEYSGSQCGSLDFTWKTVREAEYCYNILREVDISRYGRVLSSLAEFNGASWRRMGSDRQMKPTSYDDDPGVLNRNGDGTDNLVCKLLGNQKPSVRIDSSILKATQIAAFNETFDYLVLAGVSVCFSFPPILVDTVISPENAGSYASAIRKNLNAALISTPSDYFFELENMYDSNYHLNVAAARIRAEKLADDLLAYLKNTEK